MLHLLAADMAHLAQDLPVVTYCRSLCYEMTFNLLQSNLYSIEGLAVTGFEIACIQPGEACST